LRALPFDCAPLWLPFARSSSGIRIAVHEKPLNALHGDLSTFGQGRAVLKGMKAETRLSQLVEYDRSDGKVLTIVVNVDQSLPTNRNREFEIPVNSKLRVSGTKEPGGLS
jgi:hypothetical protein